jgi:hypothetical protein
VTRASAIPETITLHVPFRVVKRGGRKEMVMPPGASTQRAQPDGTLVKALAGAWRWQRQLDAGVHISLAEIAAAEKLSPSFVSRIARLALLAPELIEAILAGTLKQGVILERLEKGVPVDWEEQRAIVG